MNRVVEENHWHAQSNDAKVMGLRVIFFFFFSFSKFSSMWFIIFYDADVSVYVCLIF